MRTTIVVSGSVTAEQYGPIRREAVRLGLNPVIARDDLLVQADYPALALRMFDILQEDIDDVGLSAAVGHTPNFTSPAKTIVAKALESYGRIYAVVGNEPKITLIDLMEVKRVLWSLGQRTKVYFIHSEGTYEVKMKDTHARVVRS